MKLRMLGAASLMAVVALTGCKTFDGAQVAIPGEVAPGPSEGIIADQVILIVDASGSMYPTHKFALAHELAVSFWSSAPSGVYEAGAMTYGSVINPWVKYPSQPFDREDILDVVGGMYYIGGSTPLPLALERVENEVARLQGHTALVIYSDGKTEPTAVFEKVAELAAMHQGDLCIHTVQFGNDEAGGRLLADMVAVANCGSYQHADTVATAEGMEALIRAVFFGPMAKTAMVAVPTGAWEGIVYFDSGKANVKAEYNQTIAEAAAILEAATDRTIRIEGHTDSTDSDTSNQALGQRRADSVANALRARGIDPVRISTASFGESRPAVSNDTPAHRKLNRRAVLIIVE